MPPPAVALTNAPAVGLDPNPPAGTRVSEDDYEIGKR